MKKAKTILLLASSLTLLACGQSNKGDADEAKVPTGTEVGKEELNVHYAKALSAMEAATAVGANLKGNAGVHLKTSSDSAYSGITASEGQEVKIAANNLDASIAASQTSGQEAKASMSFAADVILDKKTTGVEDSDDPDLSYSNHISAKAYFSDKTVYADLTGAASLLSNFTTASEEVNWKRKSSVSYSGIDWSGITSFLDNMAKSSSQNDCLKGDGDVYSFVYTIEPAKIEASDSGASASSAWSGSIKAWLSFTEDGFKEIGVSGSVVYDNSVTISKSLGTVSKSTNLTIEANLKCTFSKGDDVKVEEVTNPGDYVDTDQETEEDD